MDLESAACAEAAAARGIPYLVLRSVCDPAEEDLPFDLNHCRDRAGGVRRVRVMSRALLHPSYVGGLWVLRQRVARGSHRIAGLVQALLNGEPR